MLCLTRKMYEWIQIGEEIFIQIVPATGGRQVRVRISAPKDMKIIRVTEEEIENNPNAEHLTIL